MDSNVSVILLGPLVDDDATVDMRLQVELNSHTLRIWNSWDTLRTSTKMDLGLRVWSRCQTGRGTETGARTRNWNPRSFAPATRAASSGLLVWYYILPSLSSGMTVWQTVRRMRNSTRTSCLQRRGQPRRERSWRRRRRGWRACP